MTGPIVTQTVKHPALQLTVLVDNNTLTQIDTDLRGEPGLSYFIECDRKKILFDTGYSGLFIDNAHKMRIPLYDVDYVVLSHGHLDHTWGLVSLFKLHNTWTTQKLFFKPPKLVAHPHVFYQRTGNKKRQIGSLLNEEEIAKSADLKFSKSPFWITRRLVFLGEVPRVNGFEAQKPIGKVKVDGEWEKDFLMDDSALIFKSQEGLIIITGCSHAGICNIIQYAKEICKENRIVDIIGGFHLLKPQKSQLNGTLHFLKNQDLKVIHACHCTDLNSKIALSQVVKIKDVGTGLKLKYQ
jgi:7,8-dihydropterin-6-yl-methyl-4-(beta-D-ribofuranosyl)aminobenzene 5'-phosphate synthase